MHSKMRTWHLRRHQGFTLPEALITLFILALGLFGAAAMQINALRGAHQSLTHVIASMAVQDMAELLWSNAGKGKCPHEVDIWSDVDDKWKDRWVRFMPGLEDIELNPESQADECIYNIEISWKSRSNEESKPEGDKEIFEFILRVPFDLSDFTGSEPPS